jgi:hypothetical protein
MSLGSKTFEIFSTLVPTMSPTYFLVSSNNISNAFNPKHLDFFIVGERKFSCPT